MKRLILSTLVVAIFLNPLQASASPTVAAAQKELDRLRTLAATKYEAANEATIRIKLENQTAALQLEEAKVKKKLKASSDTLAKIAIANYKGTGMGQSFELLFSSDPKKYLSDISVMEIVSRGYAKKLAEYATTKQQVQASQLVVADRTALLKAEKLKLNKEVTSANAALAKAEKILNSLKKEDRAKLALEEAARENKILNDSKKYASKYMGDGSRGSIALKFALQQIGDVYVWAAAGPTQWDCSGLTMRSYQAAGVSLPHSSRMQISYGKSVSFSSLKPGDLLFFGKPISHVSIYMGGGKMVQAPRPGKKVEVVPLTRMFGAKPFVGARRL